MLPFLGLLDRRAPRRARALRSTRGIGGAGGLALASLLALLAGGCEPVEARVLSAPARDLAGTWEADLGALLAAQGAGAGGGTVGGTVGEFAYREHWRLDGVRVVQSIAGGAETRLLGTWEVLGTRGDLVDLRLTTHEGGVGDDTATALPLGADEIELSIQGEAGQTLRLHRSFRPPTSSDR